MKNSQQEVKKDEDLLLGNHLETRNMRRGRKFQECKPSNMDNQLPADIKQKIEDIVEESVIIKVKDIPEHMAGLDLTWLDREIRKIKDRLKHKLARK